MASLFVRKLGLTLVLALWGLASMPVAMGDVLVSNLNQPAFGSYPTIFSGQWLAVPFETGSSPTRLDTVRFEERSWPGATGSLLVALYGDNTGLPGAQMAGLAGPAHPTGTSVLTYSATLQILLSPNTKYWVVASSNDPASSGGAYGWGPVNSTSYSSSFGWHLFDYDAFSPDSGTTWISTATAPGRQPLYLEVTGASVPEPAGVTVALIGVGVVMGGRSGWRLRLMSA